MLKISENLVIIGKALFRVYSTSSHPCYECYFYSSPCLIRRGVSYCSEFELVGFSSYFSYTAPVSLLIISYSRINVNKTE